MRWAHGNHAGCPIPKHAPTWSYARGCDGQLLKAATLPSTPSTVLTYRGRRNTQRPGFVPGLFLSRPVREPGAGRTPAAIGRTLHMRLKWLLCVQGMSALRMRMIHPAARRYQPSPASPAAARDSPIQSGASPARRRRTACSPACPMVCRIVDDVASGLTLLKIAATSLLDRTNWPLTLIKERRTRSTRDHRPPWRPMRQALAGDGRS